MGDGGGVSGRVAWISEFGQGPRDLSPPDPDSEQGREWNEGRPDGTDQGSSKGVPQTSCNQLVMQLI